MSRAGQVTTATPGRVRGLPKRKCDEPPVWRLRQARRPILAKRRWQSAGMPVDCRWRMRQGDARPAAVRADVPEPFSECIYGGSIP